MLLNYVNVGKDEPCYVSPLSVVAVLPNSKRGIGSLLVLKDGIHPLASSLEPKEVVDRLNNVEGDTTVNRGR